MVRELGMKGVRVRGEMGKGERGRREGRGRDAEEYRQGLGKNGGREGGGGRKRMVQGVVGRTDLGISTQMKCLPEMNTSGD